MQNLINNIIQLMQIDSHIHLASQTMRCFLFDCFSKKQHTLMINNGYLVKSHGNKQAEIFAFNNDYTHFINVVEIEEFSSLKCLKFYRFKGLSMLIYTLGHVIYLKTVNHENKEETISYQKANLTKNEEFLCFSELMKMKNYDFIIGFTSLNQFYLLTIKNQSKLEVLKIINKQESFSFLSWFRSSTLQVQCKNVYLHPYRIDDNDKFILLLSVKDKIMSLFLLQLYPENHVNTMNLVGICESLKRIIPNSATLEQIFIITKDTLPKYLDCLLSYQLKEGFMLILAVCINFRKSNIFQVSVVLEDVPGHSFSMAYHHNHLLYIQYSNEDHLYKIFKKKIVHFQQKKHSQNKQVELFITLKDQPFYFQLQDQLFINTCSEIYSVYAEHVVSSQQSDLSQLQQQLALFKNEINHTYRKQIHKLLKKKPIPIDQILYLLAQKCRKIIEWIKNEFGEFSSNEEHTYLILTLQIAITISIRNLLMFSSFQEVVSVVGIKQKEFCLKQFYQIVANSQISTVITLLNTIAQLRPEIIDKVLFKFDEQDEIKENCYEAIKTVFTQSYEIIFESSNSNQNNLSEESIITKIVSYDLGNPKVYKKILNKDPILFKTCILTSKSVNLFAQYFLAIDFTENEVKQFANQIYTNKRDNFKRLIIQILTKCKKAFKKKVFNYQKVNIILEGFLEYSHELIPEIKKSFPGLLFFYYMRTGYRKQGIQYIRQLAKSTSPTCSEVLSLTILDIQSVQQKIRDIAEKVQHYSLLKSPNQHNAQFQQILNIGSIVDESQSEKSIGEKKIKKID